LISALRLHDGSTLEMDLFGEAGGGTMRIADRWEPLGLVGGGVRVYPGLSWLAIRIDALTLLHPTERDTGSAFDTDVSFTLGVELIVPPAP
jgi:hypothetical protein